MTGLVTCFHQEISEAKVCIFNDNSTLNLVSLDNNQLSLARSE